jgi:hypothetical protein
MGSLVADIKAVSFLLESSEWNSEKCNAVSVLELRAGILGFVLNRKNIILMLISIEIML